MSQKLPFNQVPAIFAATGDGVPRLFHSLVENPPQMWNVHLWVATNFAPEAVPTVNMSVLGALPGGPPTQLLQQIALNTEATIVKVLDGYAIRGPMDLYLSFIGGDVGERMGFFGYVQRGNIEGERERRFFDPGGEIGNQTTTFQGGKGVLATAAPSAPVDIHLVDEDYIDEITLDACRPSQSIASDKYVPVRFNGGSETPIVLNVDIGAVARIFDGVPFRNAGMLQGGDLGGAFLPETSIVFTGYFTRG